MFQFINQQTVAFQYQVSFVQYFITSVLNLPSASNAIRNLPTFSVLEWRCCGDWTTCSPRVCSWSPKWLHQIKLYFTFPPAYGPTWCRLLCPEERSTWLPDTPIPSKYSFPEHSFCSAMILVLASDLARTPSCPTLRPSGTLPDFTFLAFHSFLSWWLSGTILATWSALCE